jgi:hypothetical protein
MGGFVFRWCRELPHGDGGFRSGGFNLGSGSFIDCSGYTILCLFLLLPSEWVDGPERKRSLEKRRGGCQVVLDCSSARHLRRARVETREQTTGSARRDDQVMVRLALDALLQQIPTTSTNALLGAAG